MNTTSILRQSYTHLDTIEQVSAVPLIGSCFNICLIFTKASIYFNAISFDQDTKEILSRYSLIELMTTAIPIIGTIYRIAQALIRRHKDISNKAATDKKIEDLRLLESLRQHIKIQQRSRSQSVQETASISNKKPNLVVEEEEERQVISENQSSTAPHENLEANMEQSESTPLHQDSSNENLSINDPQAQQPSDEEQITSDPDSEESPSASTTGSEVNDKDKQKQETITYSNPLESHHESSSCSLEDDDSSIPSSDEEIQDETPLDENCSDRMQKVEIRRVGMEKVTICALTTITAVGIFSILLGAGVNQGQFTLL